MPNISLTQGFEALVDQEDFDFLSQHKWSAMRVKGKVYAQRGVRINGKQRLILMHRVVLGLQYKDGISADHISMNTLDNRKSNLRRATASQNAMNRTKQENNKSGFKGVWWNKQRGKWCAEIRLNGKSIYLGLFSDPAIAHVAYCKAAIDIHKSFARA